MRFWRRFGFADNVGILSMSNSVSNGDAQGGPLQVRASLAADRSEDWARPAMDRILVVDDKPEMRELMTQLFCKWSYETVTGASVAEARNAVLTQGPFKVI